MIFKLYTMTKDERVEQAVRDALKYFKDLKVQFSEIVKVKSEERKPSLYEIMPSWAMNVLRQTKSLKTKYLQSFPHDGYDGVVLFVDKKKGLEDDSLYGQHTSLDEEIEIVDPDTSKKSFVVKKRSYIEVYVSNKYLKITNGNEYYTSNKVGAVRNQASHTFIHEIMHAYSDHINTADILHAFIEEGQFDAYQHYLKVNSQPKPMIIPLYEEAIKCLGTDVTPKDSIPDDVACAETVNAIHKKVYGLPINKEYQASTYWMFDALKKHADFNRVDTPQEGDIIISPSGHAGPGSIIPHGHVGIIGKEGKVMSNTSKTGLFEENYTIESWYQRYAIKGKYPVAYFRRNK